MDVTTIRGKNIFPFERLIRFCPVFSITVSFLFFIPTSTSQDVSKKTLDKVKLNKILQEAKRYCQKLEEAAFNFVCLEDVVEQFYHEGVDHQFLVAGGAHDRNPRDVFDYQLYKKAKRNSYLYEYKLISKEGQDLEKRTLLKKNGKKKNEKNATLETQYFRYGKIVFGPLGLLNGYWQRYHDYKIVNEEMADGEKVIVVEASPKTFLEENYPHGKVWVRESDFAILKIAWDQKSLKGFEDLKKQAALLEADQQITLISEFGYEKNGVRFPSRFIFEEAYVTKNGKRIVRSEINTVYKDYKFFTIDVDMNFN